MPVIRNCRAVGIEVRIEFDVEEEFVGSVDETFVVLQ